MLRSLMIWAAVESACATIAFVKAGQVVKNDLTLEFGRIYERPGGATQWTITGPLTYRMGPPKQDSQTAFIVTREIIEGSRVMKHVGEVVLNGMSGIRNEQYFDKSEGRRRAAPASSSERRDSGWAPDVHIFCAVGRNMRLGQGTVVGKRRRSVRELSSTA